MKKKSLVALGPGAPSLILIFVVLAMSMLGMLALVNGRNDLKLSQRSALVTQAVYELNEKAQMSWACIDEILSREQSLSADDEQYLSRIRLTLPPEYTLEEETRQEGAIASIMWTETDGMRNLHCTLEIMSMNEDTRAVWARHTLVSATAEAAEKDDGNMIEFD